MNGHCWGICSIWCVTSSYRFSSEITVYGLVLHLQFDIMIIYIRKEAMITWVFVFKPANNTKFCRMQHFWLGSYSKNTQEIQIMRGPHYCSALCWDKRLFQTNISREILQGSALISVCTRIKVDRALRARHNNGIFLLVCASLKVSCNAVLHGQCATCKTPWRGAVPLRWVRLPASGRGRKNLKFRSYRLLNHEIKIKIMC